MATADPVTADLPELVLDGMPEPTPAQAAGCQVFPWCVLGAGHSGTHSRRTRDEIAADQAAGRSGGGKRVRHRARKAASSTGQAPAARRPARAPKSTMQPLIGLAWSSIGQALETYGPEPAAVPAGRVMQFQAPYAAARLHPVLRQVPIYRRLDDATGGLFDDLGPLVLAPVLAALMASNDGFRVALLPLLVSQLEPVAVELAKAQRETRDQLRELDGLSAEVEGLMATLVAQLFAPREQPEQEGGPHGYGGPESAPAPADPFAPGGVFGPAPAVPS
jgi:hypothetical protein